MFCGSDLGSAVHISSCQRTVLQQDIQPATILSPRLVFNRNKKSFREWCFRNDSLSLSSTHSLDSLAQKTIRRFVTVADLSPNFPSVTFSVRRRKAGGLPLKHEDEDVYFANKLESGDWIEKGRKEGRKDLRSEEWIMHKVGLRLRIPNSILDVEKGRNNNLVLDYRIPRLF